jgi:putative copper export protein
VSHQPGDGPAAVIFDHGEIMRRFSIRTGMAFVFLIAVGLSIVRRRDDRLLPMVLGGVLVGILMGYLLMAAVLALIDRFGRRPHERGDEQEAWNAPRT